MAITNHAAVRGVFWKIIESYEKDLDPIFKKLYLDSKLAEHPNARIPYAKVEARWLEIIGLIDALCRGTSCRTLVSIIVWSLGYALLASSSLRTAFARLIRYLRVVTEGMQCRIEEKKSEFSCIHSFHDD
jgi:Arabinose-binding domain of AraC transcription regulator, N-term